MRIWTVLLILGIVVLGLTICGCEVKTGSSSSPMITMEHMSGPGSSEDMEWVYRVVGTGGDDFKIDDGSIALEDETGIEQVRTTGFTKETMGETDLYTGSGVMGGSMKIVDKNKDGILNNDDEVIIDPDAGADWSSGWTMNLKYKGEMTYSRELN